MLFLINCLLNLVSKLPFYPVVFQKFLDLRVLPNTTKATAWAVTVFNAWKKWRNKQSTEEGAPGRHVHDLHVMNNREMNYWLAWLVREVRR